MRRKGVSYAKFGYFFCLPFVFAFVIFSLYPIIYTLMVSISDYAGTTAKNFNILWDNPWKSYNYILMESPYFKKTLITTASLWIMNFIPQMGLSLLLTAWFTSIHMKIHFQGFFKVLFYMPNIITAASIAMLFSSLFSYNAGPINSIYSMLGFEKFYFMESAGFAKGLVAFIQCWMWYGNTTIILIAGVMGINPALFEAASVDGASGWQTFIHITLPSLRTILLFTLVTSMVGGLQMFDIPLLLTPTPGGGPDRATETTSVYIYNQAFTAGRQYNRAAAASMILFAIAAVFSGLLFFIMRDRDAIKLERENRRQRKLSQRGGAL